MSRKPHRKIGEWIASAAAAIGFVTIPFLPRAWVVRLARGLGDVGYLCMPWLKKTGRANLRVAYGNRLSERRETAILRAVFRNFALVLLDFFWFTFRNRRRLAAHVRFDPSFDPCFRTQPLIGISAHFGNWEVLGQASGQRGCQYISIAQPLRNRVVGRMLRAFRMRGGQQIVEREGGFRALLRVLKQGGRTALLMDQNTVPSKGGLYVDFFGLPVPVSRAPYLLSRLSGAPMVFIYAVADKRGNYTARASELFTAEGPLNSERAVIQRVASLTEAAIRRYPAHWLWMYKRWRYVPPGRSAEGYPDYAIPLPADFDDRREGAHPGKVAGRGVGSGERRTAEAS